VVNNKQVSRTIIAGCFVYVTGVFHREVCYIVIVYRIRYYALYLVGNP